MSCSDAVWLVVIPQSEQQPDRGALDISHGASVCHVSRVPSDRRSVGHGVIIKGVDISYTTRIESQRQRMSKYTP